MLSLPFSFISHPPLPASPQFVFSVIPNTVAHIWHQSLLYLYLYPYLSHPIHHAHQNDLHATQTLIVRRIKAHMPPLSSIRLHMQLLRHRPNSAAVCVSLQRLWTQPRSHSSYISHCIRLYIRICRWPLSRSTSPARSADPHRPASAGQTGRICSAARGPCRAEPVLRQDSRNTGDSHHEKGLSQGCLWPCR